MSDKKEFKTLNNFQYHFDFMELPESLKFVGFEDNDEILAIDAWSAFDSSLLPNKMEPVTRIHLWQNETSKEGAWTHGCLTTSIDAIPEGMVGVDTGWHKFLVLTIRKDSMSEIYEDEHYLWAHFESWNYLPLDGDKLSPYAPGADKGFCTKNNGSTSLITIYPAGLEEGIPEVCFYYPLKEGWHKPSDTTPHSESGQ